MRLVYDLTAPLNLPKFLGTKTGDPKIDLITPTDTSVVVENREQALNKANLLRSTLQWNTFISRVNQTETGDASGVYFREDVRAGAFIDAPDERGYLGDYVWLDPDWSGTPEDDVKTGADGSSAYQTSANGRKLIRGVQTDENGQIVYDTVPSWHRRGGFRRQGRLPRPERLKVNEKCERLMSDGTPMTKQVRRTFDNSKYANGATRLKDLTTTPRWRIPASTTSRSSSSTSTATPSTATARS